MNTNKKRRDPWKLATESMTGTVLATDRFKSAWLDWVNDRSERKKPMTDRAVKMQIKKLETVGHDRAIAAIEASIAAGWTGIFESTRLTTAGNGQRGSGGEGRRRKTPEDRGEYPEPERELPIVNW